MKIVNMHEAKTHFSKLVNAVLQGDEIVIAMAGKPVAKLGPIKKQNQRRFCVL
jgi:prevent-host-death family protein